MNRAEIAALQSKPNRGSSKGDVATAVVATTVAAITQAIVKHTVAKTVYQLVLLEHRCPKCGRLLLKAFGSDYAVEIKCRCKYIITFESSAVVAHTKWDGEPRVKLTLKRG